MENVTEIMDAISTMAFNETSLNVSTTTPSSTSSLNYYGEMRQIIWKTVSPIIMITGTIGNILTVLVLLRQWKTFSSTSLYLMILAISDTVVLFTGPLRNWIKFSWDIDVRYLSNAGCKTSVYITHSSLYFSSWLLVAVSVERAASVIVPHKVKLWCTKRNAAIVILALFVFIFGVDILILVMYEQTDTKQCSPADRYLDFIQDVFPWIDLCLAFAVPFALLLVCNIIIITYLQKSLKQRKRMMASHGQNKKSSGRDPTSISILMIGLCVVFFLSMTPSTIFIFYMPDQINDILARRKSDPDGAWADYQYLAYQHAVVNVVSYTNAAMNFILYVFSGTKFRKELISMFTCKKVQERGIFANTPNNRGSGGNKTTMTDLVKKQSTTTDEKSTDGQTIVNPNDGTIN